MREKVLFSHFFISNFPIVNIIVYFYKASEKYWNWVRNLFLIFVVPN